MFKVFISCSIATYYNYSVVNTQLSVKWNISNKSSHLRTCNHIFNQEKIQIIQL